ncbi:hypothetical protein VNO77_25711 [Canavalia gladiata]|uniref:Uncharacterized protein n=1 Tax=Canavalia gladiata TaxID=3824 RepID=A0AAN9L976_CANGL
MYSPLPKDPIERTTKEAKVWSVYYSIGERKGTGERIRKREGREGSWHEVAVCYAEYDVLDTKVANIEAVIRFLLREVSKMLGRKWVTHEEDSMVENISSSLGIEM